MGGTQAGDDRGAVGGQRYAGPTVMPEHPLRILLASDCYVPRLGGIEVQVHELGRQLVAAGHHVEVVTPFPGPTVVDGIQVHRLGEPLLPLDVPFTPRTFTKTEAILRGGSYDVAHFHGGVVSPFAFGGAYLSQKLGIPTVMTSHCVWNRTQRVFRLLDRGVDWKSLAGRVLRRERPGRRPRSEGSSGRATASWCCRTASTPASGGWSTSTGTRARSRWCRSCASRPASGPLPLLRMLAQVRSRAPRGVDVRLVLVGEGGQEKQIRNAIDRLRAAGRRRPAGAARPRGHPAALRRRRRVRRPGQPRVVRPGGPRGPLRRPPRGGQGPDRHPGVRRARPGRPAGRR